MDRLTNQEDVSSSIKDISQLVQPLDSSIDLSRNVIVRKDSPYKNIFIGEVSTEEFFTKLPQIPNHQAQEIFRGALAACGAGEKRSNRTNSSLEDKGVQLARTPDLKVNRGVEIKTYFSLLRNSLFNFREDKVKDNKIYPPDSPKVPLNTLILCLEKKQAEEMLTVLDIQLQDMAKRHPDFSNLKLNIILIEGQESRFIRAHEEYKRQLQLLKK